MERQWLPAEDAQLARGMLRFGQDIGKLRRYFLPVRTEEEIRFRIAQYCSRKIGANPIKVSRLQCSLPLSAWLTFCCHHERTQGVSLAAFEYIVQVSLHQMHERLCHC